MKRTTISVSDEILREVQKLKKKYYDKSFAELFRLLIQKGIEKEKEESKK